MPSRRSRKTGPKSFKVKQLSKQQEENVTGNVRCGKRKQATAEADKGDAGSSEVTIQSCSSWFGKKRLPVGNRLVWTQVSLNVTFIGPKKQRTAPQKIVSKAQLPKNVAKIQERMFEKDEFLQIAVSVPVDLQTYPNLRAAPRTFATGSSGWSASKKVQIIRDGKKQLAQITFNAVVIGSKSWA